MSTLPRRRVKPRRTTSPRCSRQRCEHRAEIDGLCVSHAEQLADKVFQAFVRERDDRCTGRHVLSEVDCTGGLQAAHVIGRGNHATRYDPENCHALCMAHHMYVDQSGREAAKYRWATAILGRNAYIALMDRGRHQTARRASIIDALGAGLERETGGSNDPAALEKDGE